MHLNAITKSGPKSRTGVEPTSMMMAGGSKNRFYKGKVVRPARVELATFWFVANGMQRLSNRKNSETIGTVPRIAACPEYHFSDAF
jgi:hypothetical protein